MQSNSAKLEPSRTVTLLLNERESKALADMIMGKNWINLEEEGSGTYKEWDLLYSLLMQPIK